MSEPPEIHAVAGPVVDSHFRDAFADRSHVTGIAEGQTFDSGLDSCPRVHVTQSVEPLGEDLGFANFDRHRSVATWIQEVNTSTRAPDLKLTARVDKVGRAVEIASSFHRAAHPTHATLRVPGAEPPVPVVGLCEGAEDEFFDEAGSVGARGAGS